ncbi:MAG: tetratricopeptide repeat protein [bacterium]|nr:tetratricopeptide repeat protein [bacterium]
MKRFLLFLTVYCISIIVLGCATTREQWVGLNNYGVKCARLSLFHEAKVWLEEAKGLNQESATIYNNLGVVYESLDLNEKAKACYEKAIELDKKKVFRKNLELFNKDHGEGNQ